MFTYKVSIWTGSNHIYEYIKANGPDDAIKIAQARYPIYQAQSAVIDL